MSKALPFTTESMARAMKAVERAGRYVVGIRVHDGVLLVSPQPFDLGSLVPVPVDAQNAPAPQRRMGEYFDGGKSEA